MATLTGDSGNNGLVGGEEADSLWGLAGNDTLTGGSGDDTLVGGADSDTAQYSGVPADYRFGIDALGGMTVRDTLPLNGDDGQDYLQNMEVLQFADRQWTMTIPEYVPTPQVIGGGIGPNTTPVLVRLGGGGFVSAWTDDSVTSTVMIRARIHDVAGSVIGTDITVNLGTDLHSPSFESGLRMAALADGGFVVVWTLLNTSEEEVLESRAVYARRYNASGFPLSGEVRVNTTTKGDQSMPSVVGLADGGYVISWSTSGSDYHEFDGVYGQRYAASGIPSGGEFQIAPHPAGTSTLAALPGGGFIAGWSAQDASGYGGFARLYNADGVAQGGAIALNGFTTYDQWVPRIVVQADGGFVAIWEGSGAGDSEGVFGRRFSPGGVALGGDFRINTSVTGPQSQATVIDLTDGGFLVAWVSQIAGQDALNVVARRFDAVGNPMGDEFVLSPDPDHYQVMPTLTALADGGYMAAWVKINASSYAGFPVGELEARRFDAPSHPGAVWAGSGLDDVMDFSDSTTSVALNSGAGQDILHGAQGNDDLNGGEGNDTASYSGHWSEFIVSGDANSAIVTGPEGTDTLTSMEYLSFDGVSVATAAAVNDAPDGVDDGNGADAVMEAGGAVTGDGTATGNVLDNDIDADLALGVGEALVVSAVMGGTVGEALNGIHGTLLLNANGGYTYNLNNSDPETQALLTGQTAIDSFIYTVSDVHGATGTATLNITIQGSTDNTAPVSSDGSAFGTEDGVIGGMASAEDADSGNTLTYSIVGANPEGVVLNGNGAFTVTPTAADQALDNGESRVVSFLFKANDGMVDSNTSTISVTIHGVNDAPELHSPTGISYTDTIYVDTFSARTGALTAEDAESNALTFGLDGGEVDGNTVSRTGSYGTLVLNTLTGAYTYTPDALAFEALGGSASDAFTVTVSDGLASDSRTLMVNISQSGVTETQGADLISGVYGVAESFAGLGGDDTYAIDALDSISESAGGGRDTVIADFNYTLGDHLENLTLTGSGNLNATGNSLDNRITGNDGDNELLGGVGDDTLAGGSGQDTLDGGTGEDVATFRGSSNGYRFGVDTQGNLLISDEHATGGLDGLDKLVNIESLLFADRMWQVRHQESHASSPEFRVNTTTADSQFNPAITALKNNDYVVTWMSLYQDGEYWGIYAQRYSSEGVAKGGEFRVNTTTMDNQYSPSITGLADGGFVVVWSSNNQDGSGWGIYGQRYDSNGLVVGTEFKLNSTTTNDQQYPSIIGLTDGGFVAAWMSNSQDGDGYGIFAQRFNDSGGMEGSEFRINTTIVNNQESPKIAALAGGGFVVTWASNAQDGSGWGVFGQLFNSSGLPAGAEFPVNSHALSDQSYQSISPLSDGGFVVTWASLDQDGSGWGIYGQRYLASGIPVGNEFRANSTTLHDQTAPKVSGLADGGFVVVWYSMLQDGSQEGVFGQRYNSSGAVVGEEFQINTTTLNSQASPSVTALSDGSFVVSWMSMDQDGSSWGIYGQKFPPLSTAMTRVSGSALSDDMDFSDSLAPVEIAGGLGHDTYRVNGRADVIENVGEGIDTVLATESHTLGDHLENLTLTGSGNLNATGNSLDNLLTGNDGDNELLGGAGDDTLTGGPGRDTAVYQRPSSDYRLSLEADGTLTVRDLVGAEGQDRVTGMDVLRFADREWTVGIRDESVNTYTDGHQDAPRITRLAGGGTVVTWQSYGQDGSDLGIYAQRYNAQGQRLGSEFRVNTVVGGEQAAPDVTALADGGFVIAWMALQGGSSLRDVYARRFNADGEAVGEVIQLNRYGEDQQTVRLTGLADGGFIATWMGYDISGGSRWNIWGHRYTAAGNATTGFEFRISSTLAQDQILPAVAGLADGGFVTAWTSYGQDGSGYAVYARRYSAEGSSAGEFRVNTEGSGDQFAPAVTALADGGYLVSWMSSGQDGSGWGVFGRRYDAAGNPAGAEYQLSTTAVSDQAYPSVSALNGGGFVVVWESAGQDGSGMGIYGRRFDASGLALGGEFRISAVTAGDQKQPAVTALADGGFEVVWASAVQDGSGLGIYRQRFDAEGSPRMLRITGSGLSDTMDFRDSHQAVFLDGGEGDDVFWGTAGNDAMDGGAGLDTVALTSDWTAVTVIDHATTVTVSGPEGVDMLTGVEYLSFNGVTVATADAVNDAPVGVNDSNDTDVVVEAGHAVTGDATATGNVLINDSDADSLLGLGETKSVIAIAGGLLGAAKTGIYGSLVLNADGSYTYTLNNSDADTEALSTGQSAIDSFTYTMIDAHGASGSATLNVVIEGSTDNTAPVLAAPAAIIYTDTILNDCFPVTSGAVSATDADGNPLSFGIVGGTVTGDSDSLTGGYGTLMLDRVTGEYLYTPDDLAIEALGGSATDSFTLTVSDGIAADSRTLTISINQSGATETNGADSLSGIYGVAEAFAGLEGDDTYTLDALDSLSEGADGGRDTVIADFNFTLGANLENLLLTGRAVTGSGNSLDNVITGNSSSNVLSGGAGNDRLDGGLGSDTLAGGTGDDTYLLDSSGDRISELAGEGTDLVLTSAGYALAANVENLTQTGTSSLIGSGNALNNVLTGNGGISLLSGGDGNDTLYGMAGGDTLKGENGNDVIVGGTGNDAVQGGAGDDTYVMARGDGTDTLTETYGSDVLWFNDASINSQQLWFRQVSSDLEVSVIGTTTKVLVKGWYTASANQVESIRAGDGKELLASEVQALVTAMASFTTRPAGGLILTGTEQAALAPVLAANWS